MSLFDVLKYQNTDLGNEKELLKLPSGLLTVYWVEATGCESFGLYFESNCRYLAKRYRSKFYNDNFQEAFNKILREYNNEPI